MEEGMDDAVANAYAETLSRLSALGARLTDIRIPDIEALPAVNGTGGFAASEAWAWHHDIIDRAGQDYDPRILKRIRRGEAMTAENYLALLAARKNLIAAVSPQTAPFDAVLAPTCPLTPPSIAEVEDEREYNRINMALLRNTAVFNFLDRCSISIPCHQPGTAPVGLMITGENGGDGKLFAVARAVEAALA
jgi:aspartyl-tRNA(Asn)/glutamyl-tRNA(Gln) amidotransferase subunit A